MAVEEKAKGKGEPEQAKTPSTGDAPPGAGPVAAEGEGAPAWLVPGYVAGLVLLYLGERVIVTEQTLEMVVSALGVALLGFTTALRFVPKFRVGGQHASVERLLGLLSVAGLMGVLVYFASTDYGLGKLGIDELESKTRESVETLLFIAWVTLVTCSAIPMLFAEAALHPMRRSLHLEARRVSAAAASGFALSVAVVYCSLFVYAAGETEAQADYSYFKTSEPGSSTRKMIESFDEPVKITAFFPDVSEVRSEAAGYLTELAKGVANVELSVVDRYLEPKLAKDLKVFSDGTIVFEKGETKRTLTLGAEMKTARKKLKTLDRDVQEQLYKLLRSRRVAYLTVGHGEINAPSPEEKAKGRSSQIVEELLRKQNYQVRTLGLAQGLAREVPDDAAMVLVLGPTEPFSLQEIDSLRRYVEGGGKLLLALDSDTVVADAPPPVAVTEPAAASEEESGGEDAAGPGLTPAQAGLKELAKVVGLDYEPGLLVNASHHVRRRANASDRALLISNRFSSHASVSTLSRNATRAAIVFARAGSLVSANAEGYKVDMALRAMGGTFADHNGNYEYDKDAEKKETYNLVAAVTAKPKGTPEGGAKSESEGEENAEEKEMRAFVLADADGLSDLLMSNFGPNRLLFMDAIRWLGGEDSYAGEINDEEDVRIEHSKQKDLVWFYATIFGSPLLVLGAGLTMARRARRTHQAES